MTLLFLYLFIQASAIPETINWAPIIISAVVALITWYIKAQMDRRYTEQTTLSKQVYQNKEKIAENALKDDKEGALFRQYKENMAEKNEALMVILNEIKSDIKELRREVSEIKPKK